jgi:hypothetical protein
MERTITLSFSISLIAIVVWFKNHYNRQQHVLMLPTPVTIPATLSDASGTTWEKLAPSQWPDDLGLGGYAGAAILSPPRARCGPGGGGTGLDLDGWLGGATNVTVVLPRANNASAATYGNAVTCGRGLRVHAFRAVASETIADVSTSRAVVLARGGGAPPADITGYSADDPALADAAAFFVIDTCYEQAFIHWAAESAVFLLAYWRELLAMHPGKLRLVLLTRRRFKEQIALSLGVSASNIIWGGLPREAALPSSITYFPPLFSLNDIAADVQLWLRLWAEFCELLRATAGLKIEPPWLPAGLLVLPRGKLENFASNNHMVESLDWIASKIAEGRGGAGATVLYTDSAQLVEQVQIVCAHRVLILNYGSAFFFNGGLARNASLFAVRDLGQLGYPGMRMLFDYIRKYNRVNVRGVVEVPAGAAALLAQAEMAMEC